MTAIAMTERIAATREKTITFPCASCGAKVTIEFKRYDVPGMPPARLTGYCSCGQANVWVLDLDGHYMRAPNRRLGITDVLDAKRVHDSIWHQWREAFENHEPYSVALELDRRCFIAYLVYRETLRQALEDAEADGYERGLEAAKQTRVAA